MQVFLFILTITFSVSSLADSRTRAERLVANFDGNATPERPDYLAMQEGFDEWYDLYNDFYDSKREARAEYNRRLKEAKRVYNAGPVQMENGSMLLYFFTAPAFDGILKKGILNQHQTGKSLQGGANNAKRRAQLEDSVIPVESEYDSKRSNPNHYLRPKSVVLDPSGVRPDLKEMVKSYGMNDGRAYGDFVAVLKDQVKARSTWSAGDSYGPAHSSSWNPPPVRSLREDVYDLNRPKGGYYEAQVWGELDLHDVKELWIPESTDERLRKKFQKAGIPIYEYTTGPEHLVFSYIERSNLVFAGDPKSEFYDPASLKGATRQPGTKSVVCPKAIIKIAPPAPVTRKPGQRLKAAIRPRPRQ